MSAIKSKKRVFLSTTSVCIIIIYITISLVIIIKMFKEQFMHKNEWIEYRNQSKSQLDNFNEFLVPRIMQMPQRSEITCFVISAVKNRKARSAIRRTWGKIIKPLFLISKNSDNLTMDFALNEAKVFDDMIIIEDNNLNGDVGTFIAMKYFVEYYNTSEYFLYARDDVFLNPKNLYDFLNDMTPENAIIGRVRQSSRMNDRLLNYLGYSLRISFLDESVFIIPGLLKNI